MEVDFSHLDGWQSDLMRQSRKLLTDKCRSESLNLSPSASCIYKIIYLSLSYEKIKRHIVAGLVLESNYETMKYREPQTTGWYIAQQEQSKPQLSAEERKKIRRYWLVEITLTSGESTHFYVQAINQFEALQKADDYASLLENEKLRTILSKFRLRQ